MDCTRRAKSWTKRLHQNAIPRWRRTSLTLVGGCSNWIAAILSESVLMPSPLIKWPKCTSLFWKSMHLPRFKRRFASRRLRKTTLRRMIFPRRPGDDNVVQIGRWRPIPIARCAHSERVWFARLVINYLPARWWSLHGRVLGIIPLFQRIIIPEGGGRQWPLGRLAGRNAEARLVGIGGYSSVIRDCEGDCATVAKCPWEQVASPGLLRIRLSWYFLILCGGFGDTRGTFPPLWLLVDHCTGGVFERGSFLWQRWLPAVAEYVICVASERVWGAFWFPRRSFMSAGE